MGIFDRLRRALGGDSDKMTESRSGKDAAAPNVSAGVSFDIDRGEMADVDRRAGIIDEHYDDVDTEEARYIAKRVKSYVEEDLRKSEMRSDIVEETKLDRDRVVEITWTERASIQKEKDIRDYPQAAAVIGLQLLGAEDDHPVCAAAQEEIEERGGAVEPDVLQDILREAAEEHEEGTPNRMDHWSPHPKCKVSLSPVLE